MGVENSRHKTRWVEYRTILERLEKLLSIFLKRNFNTGTQFLK